MMIDVAKARRETPGCEHVLHFNNAGAALMPQPVIDTVRDHLDLEARIGGYEAAAAAEDRIEAVYDSIGSLLGCDPDEVAVVDSATRAWDMAFYSLRIGAGDRILTSVAEYASNYLAFLQVAERTGAVVEAVPNDEHGRLSVAALERMIDERTRLVAVSHVPTNGGLVQPAAEIGAVTGAAGVPFLLDACQSVGHMPVDVRLIGCDMLSATSRKYLRGPRGQGFLFVRRDVLEGLEPPMIDLHAATWTSPTSYRLRADARRFESWEANVAAKLGLGAAVDYARRWGPAAIYHWVTALAALLRERLAEVPGITVHDAGAERCGIVTFSSNAMPASEIRDRLREEAINVEVSSPASTLLDATRRRLPPLVRASVHYYNTEWEVDRFRDALVKLLEGAAPQPR